MNLLKSPLRRTTAALAGAFIGLAGAVAFAAPASAHYTELSGKTDCLQNGGWKVYWTLAPKNAPIDGKIVKVEETPGGTPLENIVEGVPVASGGTIADMQSFGKDVAEVTLSVKVIWVYGKPIAPPDLAAAKLPAKGDEGHSHPGGDKPKVITYTITTTVKAPENCPQPTQPPAEAASPILEQDCDSMTIGLHNPVKGEEITLHLTPSTGAERTLVVPPNGKDTTTTFEGVTPGFSVKIRYEGEEGGETVLYRQPKDCDTGGSAGGGDTGGLPVTGAAAGTIAGGAAVLLLAGGSMFVLARRRKVKFTA